MADGADRAQASRLHARRRLPNGPGQDHRAEPPALVCAWSVYFSIGMGRKRNGSRLPEAPSTTIGWSSLYSGAALT
jgi:hypothetical protein